MERIEGSDFSSSFIGESFDSNNFKDSDNNLTYINTRARIAVYDDLLSAPRIIDIEPGPTADYIEGIASKTYEYARMSGGLLPYSVIREISENFIHAQFKECTISILDKGNTVRFSDQGPGIEKKNLVQQPGITSATSQMKNYIRGVGSGFPIVREYLSYSHGTISIEDNAVDGTVVTLSIQDSSEKDVLLPHENVTSLSPSLNKRDKDALLLLLDEGILGPTDIATPLHISVSTAYRVLEKLDNLGYIEMTANRKRILSNKGLAFIQTL